MLDVFANGLFYLQKINKIQVVSPVLWDVNYKNSVLLTMPIEGVVHMKNREKQRENRKLKRLHMDKYLINETKDLTPYNAVRVMRSGNNEDIVYK